MAGGSRFIWVHILCFCIFQAFDSKSVPHNEGQLVKKTVDPAVHNVLSKIPIILPDGGDFTNINVTSINIRLCHGMEGELNSLKKQLQEKTASYHELDKDAFELRREVRQLSLKLATCSSAVSSVTGSYQSQLQQKMNNLLEVINSETFEVLKLMAVTREVKALQKKMESASSSKRNSTKMIELQREFVVKTAELNTKRQQIERSQAKAELILQIISLQNEIWDLYQADVNNMVLQPDSRILGLQEQLERKLEELRAENGTLSDVLGMINIRTDISTLKERIKELLIKSQSRTSDVQRQLRQKEVQLKEAIFQLTNEENNKELTKKIIRLQNEIEKLEGLCVIDPLELQITEIQVKLEAKKKTETTLHRRMEKRDYPTAQLIMKIISLMEELRWKRQTSEVEPTDFVALLQTCKHDYTIAQTQINNLQEKLRQSVEECSRVEDKYERVKTELEQKIQELNMTDDNKAALIVRVISLHAEVKALQEQINNSDNNLLISKLQRKLEQKQKKLDDQIASINNLGNPQLILKIIHLQTDLWKFQNQNTNWTYNKIRDLEEQLDVLIGEINSDEESIKLMMKIMALESQMYYLKKLLASTETSQNDTINQLNKKLSTKVLEHKKYILENKSKNINLMTTIAELQNQLRKYEIEMEDKVSSESLLRLQEQLRIEQEENKHHQALIQFLQNRLNQTEDQCSVLELNITALQNNLDSKIEELNSKSESVTSLALQVSTLTAHVEEMKRQLESSVSSAKAKELQKLIDEKDAELQNKTEELKIKSTQAQRFLQIIAIQVEIERLVQGSINDTDEVKITGLQQQLAYMIEGIQDRDNKNTKLTFQILAHQDKVARLQKQQKIQLGAQVEKIKELENELDYVRGQIQEKSIMLKNSNIRVTNLTAKIVELHSRINPLIDEILDLKKTYAENLSELQERLNFTQMQLQDTEQQLKHADAKNFKLIMEIANLRAELKKAKKSVNKAAKQNIADLEQQLKNQQTENKNMQNINKDLKQHIDELNVCCISNTQCEDIKKQLQQSRADADRLHKKLQEKEAALEQLQSDFYEQGAEKNKLQEEYNNLLKKINDVEEETIHPTTMTMDPKTAHPRIVLSANLTEVTTTNAVLQVPDHSQRFDLILGVLGATGFSSGRHFWEVSVAGKTCYHLGMTSESSQRKGSISFKPNKGFWTILLNKQGELKALDRRPVPIQVNLKPLTLGILLDYKRGQISFYDAGSRSHLYSFSGQSFTDKIYPFVNYCVEESVEPRPIALLPPGSTDWII